jgi:hypothetical protein
MSHPSSEKARALAPRVIVVVVAREQKQESTKQPIRQESTKQPIRQESTKQSIRQESTKQPQRQESKKQPQRQDIYLGPSSNPSKLDNDQVDAAAEKAENRRCAPKRNAPIPEDDDETNTDGETSWLFED